MIEAIRDDNPVIFVEHKKLYVTKGEVLQRAIPSLSAMPESRGPVQARMCSAGVATSSHGAPLSSGG